MSDKYRIAISGRTLSGAPLSSVEAEVGKAFGLGDEQLQRMLCGKPVVVSREASAEAAEKLVARLRSLDLEARADLLTETRSEVPAPPRRANPPSSEPASPPSSAPDGQPASPPAGQELFALAGPNPVVRPVAAAGTSAEAPPVDGVTCPKCGESQPKRTLCRACGLDMPRFQAIQEAQAREEREARAAELAARRSGSGGTMRTAEQGGAALLGLGFGGRFGRLDYLSASLLSSLLWLALVWLAVVTGKNAFAGLGMLLSLVYALRAIALRLHDTGRTGWLALVAVVPVIGALMALALLFVGGDEDGNEYGAPPGDTGGRRAILAFLAFMTVSGLAYRAMQKNPEAMLRFAAAMSVGQGQPALAGDPDEEMFPGEPVRYAPDNRIDVYVVAGCTDCDAMLAWLHASALHPTVYRVDSDRHAAERLQSIMGGSGRIQLPVLEVNGEILSANPDFGTVHGYLRVASE